jgi:hypothetical protein
MSPITYDMNNQSTRNVISVPKLRDNGSNWVNYESKVQSALGAKGIIRHVDGMAIKSLPYVKDDDDQYIVSPEVLATEEQIEAREKCIDKYIQHEHTAQHILLMGVSLRIASVIQSKSAGTRSKMMPQTSPKFTGPRSSASFMS